jgi:DNA-binding CsgD family transcriptional regulator
MGLFNWFKIRTGPPKMSTEEHRRIAAAFSHIKEDISRLDGQIGTIHIALHKHDDEITECRDISLRHERTLVDLEQMVRSPSVQPRPNTDQPTGTTVSPSTRRLDIDRFSEQQKRLLAVFFQNRDRAMSYADLAVILGKSAYTIKNQMNQIRHKADLFDRVIGPQSRNFFRLKDDLKVERYLDVGRSIGRPVSMAGSDRSAGEQVSKWNATSPIHKPDPN